MPLEMRPDIDQLGLIDDDTRPHKRDIFPGILPDKSFLYVAALVHIQVIGDGGELIIYIEIAQQPFVPQVTQGPRPFYRRLSPVQGRHRAQEFRASETPDLVHHQFAVPFHLRIAGTLIRLVGEFSQRMKGKPQPGRLRLPFGRESIARLREIEPVRFIKKIEMDLRSIVHMQPPQKGQIGVVKNAVVDALVPVDIPKEPDIVIYREAITIREIRQPVYAYLFFFTRGLVDGPDNILILIKRDLRYKALTIAGGFDPPDVDVVSGRSSYDYCDLQTLAGDHPVPRMQHISLYGENNFHIG